MSLLEALAVQYNNHIYNIDMITASRVNKTITTLVFMVVLMLSAFASSVGAVSYPSDMVGVHRFYNKVNGSHFFTASQVEANSVKARWPHIYTYEGLSFHAVTTPTAGRTPVYRFYNVNKGTHFFTSSSQESESVKRRWPNIFKYEGVAYYNDQVSSNSSAPLYRFYNVNIGSHFYTTSSAERDSIIRKWPRIYTFEGTAYSVAPTRYYRVCQDAHDAGVTPIYRGQPGYRSALDRDNDGIACETGATGKAVVAGSVSAKISRVIDGDTVDALINSQTHRVRMIGVDTPETVKPGVGPQCYGLEASNFTKVNLTNKTVTLEADSTQGNTDKYSRLLRYIVMSDTTNFNERLIREGYAREYRYSSDYLYMPAFRSAETYARSNFAGLWSAC